MGEFDAPMLSYQTPQRPGWVPLGSYRPVRTMGIALVALLGVATGVTLLHVVFLYLQVGLLEAIKARQPIAPGVARMNDLRINMTGGLILLLVAAGAVLWLIWFYRAYKNVPVLTGVPTKHTKGWAVGGYFVPFLNLVRVPEMMSEAWKGSDAGPAGGAIVVVWWLCWIFCGILSRVADVVMQANPGQRPTLDSLISGTWVYFAGDSLRVFAGVLAILLVAAISKGQTQKFRVVAANG